MLVLLKMPRFRDSYLLIVVLELRRCLTDLYCACSAMKSADELQYLGNLSRYFESFRR